MKKKKNVIRKYNPAFIIPQITIFLLFALVFKFFQVEKFILLALATYFLTSGYLKVLIPKWHRKGLFYSRKGEMEGAIHCFIKSYEFFMKNAWIDKYRAYTMFSLSGYSYTEMALMNIVYCYQQLNNKEEINKYHKLLSDQFPENPYSK